MERCERPYSHRDTGWAKWLHARLEGFCIDKDVGPVPKTLRPIFRDREDFSGGHTLTEATVTALDASATLIVLCSTVSAGRPAINEEVRLFRSRHPDRPVIPVIINGTAPDNFPAALRYELAADGTITDRSVTILGPDLRDSADGKNLGLAKTVAGLTGLSPDDIFRRAERARRRRVSFSSSSAPSTMTEQPALPPKPLVPKPGTTSDLGHDNELGRDDVECQFEASKLTSSAGMEGAAAEQKRAELEALCMQARGWSRQ